MTTKRPISAEGVLSCSKCKEQKHISEFYQKVHSVWFLQEDPETGMTTVYGKPMSWCKQCMKDATQVRNKRYRDEARKAKTDADVEWERLVDAAYEIGLVVVKDPDGTVRGIREEDWNR